MWTRFFSTGVKWKLPAVHLSATGGEGFFIARQKMHDINQQSLYLQNKPIAHDQKEFLSCGVYPGNQPVFSLGVFA
jgi:hypothetical protein